MSVVVMIISFTFFVLGVLLLVFKDDLVDDFFAQFGITLGGALLILSGGSCTVGFIFKLVDECRRSKDTFNKQKDASVQRGLLQLVSDSTPSSDTTPGTTDYHTLSAAPPEYDGGVYNVA